MPINNNTVVCVNHPDTPLNAQPGFQALTVVQRAGQQVAFNPASGIPVKAVVCPKCGYMELYAAIATSEWQELANLSFQEEAPAPQAEAPTAEAPATEEATPAVAETATEPA